jgi:hypothetical protein
VRRDEIATTGTLKRTISVLFCRFFPKYISNSTRYVHYFFNFSCIFLIANCNQVKTSLESRFDDILIDGTKYLNSDSLALCLRTANAFGFSDNVKTNECIYGKINYVFIKPNSKINLYMGTTIFPNQCSRSYLLIELQDDKQNKFTKSQINCM